MRIRAIMAVCGLAIAMAATPVQAQSVSDLVLRLDRLEAELRTLTGMVEELTFRVQDLEQLVAVLRADNEALYQLLSEFDPELAAAQAAAAESPPVVADESEPVDPAPNEPQLSEPPPVLDPQPDELAGVSGQPLDLAGALRPGGGFNIDGAGQPVVVDEDETPVPEQPVPSAALVGDQRADYDRAYQYLLNGDYEQAEASFRAFLAAYPGSDLRVDAQFWVAESQFSRGQYRAAADSFYAAYTADPRHARAPDMLLKLSVSLAELGQVESACATLDQILQIYPDASNAMVQRIAAEKANAGC